MVGRRPDLKKKYNLEVNLTIPINAYDFDDNPDGRLGGFAVWWGFCFDGFAGWVGGSLKK